MYIPPHFRENDTEKLVAFMQAHSFATLISVADGVPIASHVPLVVTFQNGVVTLTGHLAKANAQWRQFEHGESLAVFTGPHAYVSPTLYERTENVPTWNYIAVHAYGVPKILTLKESPAQMEAMIGTMIKSYEATYQEQWQNLSEDYRDRMMQGIVGFEMTVTRLQGKYKMSQNRSLIDQHQVAQALLQSSDPDAKAIGEEMTQRLDSPL
jgi:transcriptional regulator